jgi:hypothetical protein
MDEFAITIIRTTSQARTFKVLASSESEAKGKALDLAADTVWSTDSAEYLIEDCNKVKLG